MIDRRRTLAALGGAALAALGRGGAAAAGAPIPIADMHRHLFFNRLESGESRPLGAAMAGGGATLVAWALRATLPGSPRASAVSSNAPFPGPTRPSAISSARSAA